MKDKEFTIYYDDTPNDVVDKISYRLRQFGLTIDEVNEGDGEITYRINLVTLSNGR